LEKAIKRTVAGNMTNVQSAPRSLLVPELPAPEYIYAHGRRYVTVEHMADQMLAAFETGKREAMKFKWPVVITDGARVVENEE
jgi:hypothetical protein